MTVKVVTFTETLMRLAYELGQARLSGDSERIAKAERAHEDYRQACLGSDEMRI